MKPRERGGVVNSHLKVYGIRCLKLAHLPIGAPGKVAVNTCLTALIIGDVTVIISEGLVSSKAQDQGAHA